MLKRKVGDASGHYTLVFKKINGEWKIISDHSS
jgi:ketosteroid isomerase-like protein